MKTKDEYINRLTAELHEWSAEIDVLSAKIEAAAAEAKLQYLEEINELRAKQQMARDKLVELQAHSGDAWEAIKESADNIWDELRTGIANVASKFK